eukprot:841263-Prymnesium_polylepis.2
MPPAMERARPPQPSGTMLTSSSVCPARALLQSVVTMTATTSLEPPPPPVRWGIVGLGDVTAVKSGPPFWKCTGSRLVAAMRHTPGAAAAWAQRVPGGECTGYDNLDAFLAHPGLDAVYIATPPGGHCETALRVAAAGKHCYVEKPVGRCGRETAAIAAAFEASGTNLYSAYISRAYERTAAVRALLAEGILGECVTDVSYTMRGTGGARGMDGRALPWRLNAAQAGGGLVMDVGCHVVDRIDYWLGPLESVTGSASNRNSPRQKVEDYVTLRATVGPSSWAATPSKGARVACSWDFGSQTAPPMDKLVISGPRGSLEMAAMSAAAPVSLVDADGKLLRELTFEAPEHAAQPLVQAMTDELRGVGQRRCPSRADNALRTSRVLDAALGSYYGGRDDAFWSRPESWDWNWKMIY